MTPPSPDWILGRAKGLGEAISPSAGDRLSQYWGLVELWSRKMNLVGPSALERFWEEHLAECVWLRRHLPPDEPLADLGSGAGLPGLVLACLEPGRSIHLMEARQKKARFLRLAAAQLELKRVEIYALRVGRENTGAKRPLAVSRAAAPLDRLLSLASHLVAPGGRLVALKGPGADAELALVKVSPGWAEWSLESSHHIEIYNKMCIAMTFTRD